jgi:hypothetical protein
MITRLAVNNRYIIAKYVRDVRRMEPRNIGLFLWADGRIVSKFLSVEDAPFISERANYRRWRDLWTQQISGDVIEPVRGPAVSKASPEFMDALLKEQEGNYRLVDGGRVLDDLKGKDIEEAADFLFDQLVSRRRKIKPDDHDTLKTLADFVIQEAGLAEQVHRRRTIKCPIYGKEQDIVVDYSLGNGMLEAIFQRVSLRNLMAARGTAFTFQSLTDAKKIASKKRCCMLVDLNDPHAESSVVGMMKHVGEIANVAEPKKAVTTILQVAKAALKGSA